MTRKRDYEEPRIEVFDVQPESVLLAGSGEEVNGGLNDPNDFPNAGDPFSFI